MKFHRSYFFSLCAIATLGLLGCDEEDPNVKTCHATSECGSAEDWKCNIETNTCEELNPAHCKNQRKDDNETDIDCGGACGYKCENNKICAENKDCKSAYCSDKNLCATKPCTSDLDCTAADPTSVCLFPETGDVSYGTCVSCSDGQKNGSETDVDCGGTCATLCDQGKSCSTNSDCITAQCTSGVCTGDIPNAPTASDLVINEVLPAANKSTPFETIKSGKSCDFAEIVNVGTKPVSLEGVKLVVQRTDKEEKAAEYDLKGVLAPKQAAVVHACAESPFSGSEDFLLIFHEKFDLTNSGLSYTLSLKLGETQLTSVSYAIDKEHSAKSLNLNPDLNISNPTLTYHNELSTLSHSPGLCMNGQPFSTGCIDSCSNNVKDNDESDIDCGGSCNTKCANGKTCNSGADCLTGTCTGGTCSGDVPNDPVKGDLIINEIMSNAKTGAPFNNTDVSKQCDFIEILNVSDKTISLNNVAIHTSRDNKDEKKTLPLQGSLTKNQVALYHACDEANGQFPSDILAISNTGFKFVNDAGYTVQLLLNESTELASVVFTKQSSGISSNLTQDKNTADTTLVPHNTVSELPYSPGRCSNGASFAADCKLTCDNTIKDGNESDVNCGGSCAPCELGQTCNSENDCASGYCNNDGKCDIAPCSSNDDCEEGQVCTAGACVDPCTNGTKDGDEVGVDCGGSCATLCPNGTACTKPEDCINGECNNNVCAGEVCDEPEKGELVINEVLGYLSNPNESMNYAEGKEVEFIELYNTSATKHINVKNLAIELTRLTDNNVKTVSLANVSCLAPDHYLVLSGSELTLKGPKAVSAKVSNIGFNDKVAYDLKLYNKTTSDVIHEANMPECTSRGVSLARTGGFVDDDTTKISLQPHNTLTYYSKQVTDIHSPGVDNFTSVDE